MKFLLERQHDDLDPSRGIVNGCIIAIPVWIGIIFIILCIERTM
jgi:hypothetical protein